MGLPALPIVADPGLDQTAKELSPARISEVINRVLDRETAARLHVYLNTCVHCGLCSDACHWFLSNDRDPRFSPVGKVKQTLWEIIKRKGNVTPEFLKDCSRIAHTECNVCRRCSMYLSIRNRPGVHDSSGKAYLQRTRTGTAIPSGYREQPCSYPESDVGQTGRVDRHSAMAG